MTPTFPFSLPRSGALLAEQEQISLLYALGLKSTRQYLAAPHPHYLRELRGEKQAVTAGVLPRSGALLAEQEQISLLYAVGLKSTRLYLAAPHPHFLRELRGEKKAVAASVLPRSGALLTEPRQKAWLCTTAYDWPAVSLSHNTKFFSVSSVPSVFKKTGKRSAANPPITHHFA